MNQYGIIGLIVAVGVGSAGLVVACGSTDGSGTPPDGPSGTSGGTGTSPFR